MSKKIHIFKLKEEDGEEEELQVKMNDFIDKVEKEGGKVLGVGIYPVYLTFDMGLLIRFFGYVFYEEFKD